MSTFEIWKDATLPILQCTVYEQKSKQRKDALDLSLLDTAKLVWSGDDDIINERIMNLVDPDVGLIEYRWQVTDTAIPGVYNMHIELLFTDGAVLVVTEVPMKKDKLFIIDKDPVVCTV